MRSGASRSEATATRVIRTPASAGSFRTIRTSSRSRMSRSRRRIGSAGLDVAGAGRSGRAVRGPGRPGLGRPPQAPRAGGARVSTGRSEPLRERVQRLGHLDVEPGAVRLGDAGQDRQDPFGRLARPLDRVEVEPGGGAIDRESQRVDRPVHQGAEGVGPLGQEEVARVEASGRVSTRTSTSCPRNSSSARSAAFWPASSPSKTRTTRSARRRRARTWSSPRAVPRVPTTLARPT